MIELINIKKDYVASKNVTHALRGVSFKLPDKGMVFITGKSGSGKSTLMNVLGGLDDKTDGEIYIDGVQITGSKNSVLDEYRNKYVGIIYQSFNLFPNETVYENIKIAVEISDHNITEEDYDNLLKKLDLFPKKHTLVKNLSGGQRQRVAIARTLIKKPELILADEPTGNLDSKSAKIIFDYLKEISKEKLVVVISHDQQSAENYGDRIIFLKDGLIESDKVKNTAHKTTGKVIEIKGNQSVSKEELAAINKKLGNDVKIVSESEKYSDFTGDIEPSKEIPKFESGKLKVKPSFKLAWKFFKSGRVSFAITLLICTILFTLLSLSRSFVQFDGKDALDHIIQTNNIHNFIVNKGYSEYENTNDVDKETLVRVPDSDIQKFRDNGYDGKIYEILNNSTSFSSDLSLDTFKTPTEKKKTNALYLSTGHGTVVCDSEYLTTIFGEDYEVCAGSIENTLDNDHLIVTDYFADSLIANGKDTSLKSKDPYDPYQNIINRQINGRFTIGAVINTHYMDRYQELFYLVEQIVETQSNSLGKVFFNSELYAKFRDEVASSLSYSYSINPNFKKYYSEHISHVVLENAQILTSEGLKSQAAPSQVLYLKSDINDGEIVLSQTAYNSLFPGGKKFEERGDDIYINLQLFTMHDDKTSAAPFKDVKLKVAGVVADIEVPCIGYLNRADLASFIDATIIRFGLVLTDMSQIYKMSKIAVDNYYYTKISVFSVLFSIFDSITLFNKMFLYVVLIILGVLLVLISYHNLRTVKKNQYRIGVYRGLGYSNKNIVLASVINLLILTLALGLFSFISTLIFDKLVNLIMVTTFYERMKSSFILEFTLIKFSPSSFALFNSIIFAISFISIIAPVIYIRYLKPNKILHKADD